MLTSIPFLQAVNGWCLVIALAAGIISAGAGFISGLAGNRLNDLQEARRQDELNAMREKDQENEAEAKKAQHMAIVFGS